MVNILITNAYSWYNKGDAGIVISMFSTLRKYIQNTNISVISRTPKIDKEKYHNYNVEVLEDFVNYSDNDQQRFSKKVNTLILMIACYLWIIIYSKRERIFKMPLITDENVKTLKRFYESDIVISCGGGFLHDNAGYTFLLHLYSIFLAIRLKKPIVIYAQSIGPFKNNLYKRITGIILNKVDLITVREKISYNNLMAMGVDKPDIFITADSAFVLDSISQKDAKRLLSDEKVDINNDLLIGVTVRYWVYPGSKDITRKNMEFVEKMSQIIDNLVEQRNAIVVFFPQAISPYDTLSDDNSIAFQIYQKTKYKSSVKVLSKDFSPEELKGISGLMDVFIGTRMHSNIFATSMGTPVIAIEYHHKTKGIMEMLGFEEYIHDISNLEVEKIVANVDKILTNREEIVKKLKEGNEKVRYSAFLNGKLVSDLINKIHIDSSNLR